MSMDRPMANLVILSGFLKYTSLFVYLCIIKAPEVAADDWWPYGWDC